MNVRDLYHGANGDKIVGIIRDRQMRPAADGTIFFSQYRYESVLMHGADLQRKVALAAKVRVNLPPEATVEHQATPGVADTLVVRTGVPIPAEVLELYVRQPRATTVQVIRGIADILQFLR